MKKALIYGILASAFFAFTFVLNRSMNLSGGYWGWSASLRYFFTLPVMWLLAARNGGVRPVLQAVREKPREWLLWSTVGFGLFYAPLTLASVYGESWFVAATWQVTIVAGVLLTPFFEKKLPKKNLLCSGIIVGGIFLMQLSHLRTMKSEGMLTAGLLILLAAFAYPLGNRSMLKCCPEYMGTNQRVFGMTLCSMPFWGVLSVFSLLQGSMPPLGQVIQSLFVALFSGVAATVLFFEATSLVKENPRQLAVIEATQSGEVLFTLLGGILFLGESMPSTAGFLGIAVIVAGMVANSLTSVR